MVVADETMIQYHGNGLLNYILVLMSTVSRITVVLFLELRQMQYIKKFGFPYQKFQQKLIQFYNSIWLWKCYRCDSVKRKEYRKHSGNEGKGRVRT